VNGHTRTASLTVEAFCVLTEQVRPVKCTVTAKKTEFFFTQPERDLDEVFQIFEKLFYYLPFIYPF
jgi:hypothetical protein